MALFGSGGLLELGRERPEITALQMSRIEGQTLIVQNPAFFPSDLVTLTSDEGLPLDLNGDGYADCPDGHAMYQGGTWELGPPRSFWLPWIETNQPMPRVIHSRGAALSETNDTLTVTASGLVTGDRAVLTGFGGLPLDLNSDGFPDNPDGLGFYGGSTWRRGPNTISRTDDNGYFYLRAVLDGGGPESTPETVIDAGGPTPGPASDIVYGDDSETLFYDSYVDVGYAIQVVYYVRVVGNNLTFYSTRDAAVVGGSPNRIPLLKSGFRRVIVSRYNPDVGEAALGLLRDYAEAIYGITETTYSSIDLATLVDLDYTVYLAPGVHPFYPPESENNTPFYCNASNVGLTKSYNFYISRDELDRVTLYSNALGALNEGEAFKMPLRRVDAKNLLLTLFNESASYVSNLIAASAQLNRIPRAELPGEEFPLSSAIPISQALRDADAEEVWKLQGDMLSWALDIDAAALDTSAIGEVFGDHIKAVVRGAGSLSYQIERRLEADRLDALTILRTVLLTQKGSQAHGKFYMYKDRDLRTCVNDGVILPQGSLFYDCRILLTNSKVSVSPDDIIKGTTDFVVVGEPRLRAVGLLTPADTTAPPPLIDALDFLDQHAFCVSVIDESTVPQATHTSDWQAFRTAWPDRRFTLLVPGQLGDVPLPNGWNGSAVGVNRDLGVAGSRSDWFSLAGMESATAGEVVYLYVDQSGSMTTATVQASYDYFLQRCTTAGLILVEVSSESERYIAPFVSTPDPAL